MEYLGNCRVESGIWSWVGVMLVLGTASFRHGSLKMSEFWWGPWNGPDSYLFMVSCPSCEIFSSPSAFSYLASMPFSEEWKCWLSPTPSIAPRGFQGLSWSLVSWKCPRQPPCHGNQVTPGAWWRVAQFLSTFGSKTGLKLKDLIVHCRPSWYNPIEEAACRTPQKSSPASNWLTSLPAHPTPQHPLGLSF